MYKFKKNLTPLIIHNHPVFFKHIIRNTTDYERYYNHNVKFIYIKKDLDDSYTNINLINIDIYNRNDLNYFIKLAKEQSNNFNNNIKPWDEYNYNINNSACIIAFNKDNKNILGWMNINFKEIYFDDICNINNCISNDLKFYIAIINNFDISNNSYFDKNKIINDMILVFKENFLKNVYLNIFNKFTNTIDYTKVDIDIYCIYSNLFNSHYFTENFNKPDTKFDMYSVFETVHLYENQYTYERISNNPLFKKNILFDDKTYSLADHIFYNFNYCFNDTILKYIRHKLLDLWFNDIQYYIF
jgi:hypothetical protein